MWAHSTYSIYGPDDHIREKQLHRPEEQILSRDEQILSRDEQILSRDEQILSRDEQILSRDEQILSRDEQILSRDEQILSRDEQMLSRDEQILSRDEQILSRDEQILSRDEQILSRDEQILSRDEQILSRDEQILSRDEQILSRDEHIRCPFACAPCPVELASSVGTFSFPAMEFCEHVLLTEIHSSHLFDQVDLCAKSQVRAVNINPFWIAYYSTVARWDGVVCVGKISHVFHSRRERAHEPFYKRTYSPSPCEESFCHGRQLTLSFPAYIWWWTSIVWTRDGFRTIWFWIGFLHRCKLTERQFVTFLLDPITPVDASVRIVRVFVSLQFVFVDFIFNLALTLLSVNINIWQRIPASFYKRIYRYINKRMN